MQESQNKVSLEMKTEVADMKTEMSEAKIAMENCDSQLTGEKIFNALTMAFIKK